MAGTIAPCDRVAVVLAAAGALGPCAAARNGARHSDVVAQRLFAATP